EKYQMALDRYWNTKKSPWEVGRLYERYVGYLYEQEGFSVSYHGILEGYDDMGRDLICKKQDAILIVQCKCWARVKIIHEKHINQLFGTTAKYLLELQEQSGTVDLFNDHKVFAHFITSANLSERADKFAKALKIQVRSQLPLMPFPCIKCNIANDGERIYHLPFDQQYDRTIVHKDRGEFYSQTIDEAEQKGFRRAWCWRGTKQSAS
ncbi:MAG: restriction endonuclease, partial [Limisphaerales bacterium]